jgi:putative ABC transport system substrate-binding protein
MRRRDFIAALGGAAIAWPQLVRAQQPGRIRRIGVMMSTPENSFYTRNYLGAFRAGLEALGWREGRTIGVEYRWGDGGPGVLPSRAQELVALNPEVIFAVAASSLIRLKEVTRTIPIVFANVPDPVSNGFVASLPRPGGNITGFANYEQTVGAKWIELLKQIAPRVSRAAFVYDPSNPATAGYLRAAEAAAPSFDISVSGAVVSNLQDIERVIGAFASEPNGGLIIPPGPTTTVNQSLVVALAARHRLPAIFPYSEDVKAGALASYGVDPADLFRRAASYVDRILKGEKPGDLPVQYATKYHLAINLKTAKALGLDVPVSLLARTDEVIE